MAKNNNEVRMTAEMYAEMLDVQQRVDAIFTNEETIRRHEESAKQLRDKEAEYLAIAAESDNHTIGNEDDVESLKIFLAGCPNWRGKVTVNREELKEKVQELVDQYDPTGNRLTID